MPVQYGSIQTLIGILIYGMVVHWLTSSPATCLHFITLCTFTTQLIQSMDEQVSTRWKWRPAAVFINILSSLASWIEGAWYIVCTLRSVALHSFMKCVVYIDVRFLDSGCAEISTLSSHRPLWPQAWECPAVIWNAFPSGWKLESGIRSFKSPVLFDCLNQW